jgi:hypothetical protein
LKDRGSTKCIVGVELCKPINCKTKLFSQLNKFKKSMPSMVSMEKEN